MDARLRAEARSLSAAAPGRDPFAAFYDLTAAEARIYQALVDGLSVAEAAERGAVSTETVRSQVKSLLRKTGRRTQPDLLSLAHQLGYSAVG